MSTINFLSLFLLFGAVLSTNVKISCTSQNGNFSYKVFNSNGGPVVVFGDKSDTESAVYCLQFSGIYETNNYNKTTCDPDPVPSTIIDLANHTYIYHNSSDCRTFSIETDIPSKELNIRFDYEVETIYGNNALKYTFNLYNYAFTSTESNAKLILEVVPQECEDVYNIDSIDDDSMGAGSDDDLEDNGVRRLLDDSIDNFESDSRGRDQIGVSSDDSDDFDLDAMIFRNTPNATVICGIDTLEEVINVDMCYNTFNGNLLLAFDRFGGEAQSCNVRQDPFAIIDRHKFLLPSTTKNIPENTDYPPYIFEKNGNSMHIITWIHILCLLVFVVNF